MKILRLILNVFNKFCVLCVYYKIKIMVIGFVIVEILIFIVFILLK
jgi:hypothetical protein